MIRFLEFCRTYWRGVLLVICILILICAIGHFGLETKTTRYLELTNAIEHGRVIQGRIIKYRPYRGGWSDKYGIHVDEGVDVAIEYSPSSGQRKTFFEKWPIENGIKDSEMIDQPVGIYYYSQNKNVEAVSFNNSEAQFYLENEKRI